MRKSAWALKFYRKRVKFCTTTIETQSLNQFMPMQLSGNAVIVTVGLEKNLHLRTKHQPVLYATGRCMKKPRTSE